VNFVPRKGRLEDPEALPLKSLLGYEQYPG